jgi:hypothetical protein
LNQKFGLFSNTAIFTLDTIRDESGNITKNFKTHYERAELSNIKLVSKQDIVNETPMKNILK